MRCTGILRRSKQAWRNPVPCDIDADRTRRAEAAITSGGLDRLAADLRSQLAQLARADYTGHALLQAKKQASREAYMV